MFNPIDSVFLILEKSGFTLKPIIIAFEDVANATSVSVIGPTPE